MSLRRQLDQLRRQRSHETRRVARCYTAFRKDLAEKASPARLIRDHHPDLEWAYIRKINLLVANGDSSAAEQLCRVQAAELQSAPLYEKLGDIAPSGERAAAYRRALELAGDLYRAKRITQKLEALLKTQ